MRKNVILLMSCALAVLGAFVWLSVRPSAPPTLAERADAVASTLRCPVCESLSVKDSTSDVAREMHDQITEQLRAGRSPDEIKASFTAAYGETVLLSPEPRGVNLVAWGAPFLVLIGGGAVTALVVRRWTQPRRRSA